MNNKDDSFKCCDCGVFCSPYAFAIPWGSIQDLEPPDPVFFCIKCFRKWEESPKIDAFWVSPRKTELTEIMTDSEFQSTDNERT